MQENTSTETHDVVPAYRLAAAREILADRERELLALKGPCSSTNCRLHYAHAGPCDIALELAPR